MKGKILFILISILFSVHTYSQPAEEYFKRAEIKHNSKDYIGAIVDYTKSIGINPKFSLKLRIQEVMRRLPLTIIEEQFLIILKQ